METEKSQMDSADDDNFQTHTFIFRDFINKSDRNFGRIIVFEVADCKAMDLTGQFVLIIYYWNNNATPHQLPVGKQYQARSIGKSVKKIISDSHHGKAPSASAVYHQAATTCTTPEDIVFSPYYRNSGGKRFVSYVRGLETVKRCGKLDMSGLAGNPDVFACEFESEGAKVNYIVCTPYLLSLIAQNAHNPIQINVTFKMSNYYILTTTVMVDAVVNRRTGSKTFISGPVMFTQSQTEASYAQMAEFIAARLQEHGWDLKKK
ncbi:uncharacterized protein LOC129601583 [Paramacrobiotus metropolitanus]|uniref:uncharacterized protein LOC129601583 n=1 Tax=Paramacrobiotus metropolitanus TaxID=2943436 RepID=UPI002446011F|nr:uncharacterized protein LOC129601583 [Paramacrobiotus metropolitanus]